MDDVGEGNDETGIGGNNQYEAIQDGQENRESEIFRNQEQVQADDYNQ